MDVKRIRRHVGEEKLLNIVGEVGSGSFGSGGCWGDDGVPCQFEFAAKDFASFGMKFEILEVKELFVASLFEVMKAANETFDVAWVGRKGENLFTIDCFGCGIGASTGGDIDSI